MDANSSQTILITGGTGFAGSHLIEYLKTVIQPEIIHTTHMGEVPGEIKNWLPEENFHRVDLTDMSATVQLLKTIQPRQLYHLAAFSAVGSSFEKSRETVLNNIGLQLNILEAVQHSSPHTRVLVIGSADGYGISEEGEIPIAEDHPFRPINPYSVSKLAQELLGYAYAKSWNLDIVRVRPFNHIGERQTDEFAVSAFAKQIVAIEREHQTTLKVGNLDAVRDFTDVKDVVRAYHLLMEKGLTGEVYNVGSGVGTKMSDLLDQLLRLSTVPITVESDNTRVRALDIPVVIANNEKITSLGWTPEIPLEESLERVVAYWRSQ